jgi:hypothetical protein
MMKYGFQMRPDDIQDLLFVACLSGSEEDYTNAGDKTTNRAYFNVGT